MSRRLNLIIIATAIALALVTVGVVVWIAMALDNDGRGVDGLAPTSSSSATFAAHQVVATTVDRVVDGDTLVADVGGRYQRVRLIGVDTPETVSPSKPVQCFGKQASDHLKALLPKGTAIRLVGDAESHDRYGRPLAYVYRQSDQLFVNLELARDGYASLLTFPPNVAHETQFADAVDRARQLGRGLWGTCGGPGVALSDQPTTTARDPGSGG
jgi:micrococcal nuclease